MLVIWNPNAGSVNAAREIRQNLSNRPGTRLCETKTAQEATELVAAHLQKGENQIIAAGGDGTINAVINGMMQLTHDAVLGVLPLGTANDWCASLGVPDDLQAALAMIDQRKATPIDVIELETPNASHYFANIATGGNSHRVTDSITSEMKQRWGALCYLRGAIGVLNDLETFDTRISFDGEPPESFAVWNIIVANGKTSGGRLEVAPKAVLNDGLLDVVIIRDGTLVDLAGMTVQLLTSRDYIESDQVEYRQAKSISIQSEPPLLFSIDGDLVEQQPIRFRACPNALRVVCSAT